MASSKAAVSASTLFEDTSRKTARVSPTRRLTQNDSKVLGNYRKKLEKTLPPKQFSTRAFKTIRSNYTPVVSKASNEQIFKERRELVCNWFTMWNDSQRKRFIDLLLRQCKKSQMYFIQNWFSDHVPLRHLDFTRVLPRFLSLRVLSYLNPRSLCRAAQVSWHWKFLAEQDFLWASKCMRHGWFLPYDPTDNEYGAWKWHYMACVNTLDVNVLNKQPSDLYGSIGEGRGKTRRQDKKKVMGLRESREVLEMRPPWQPPDKSPRDLELSAKALAEGLNPNDPKMHPSQLLHHNKWGVPKSRLNDSIPNFGYKVEERDRNKPVVSRSLDDLELNSAKRVALSERVDLESFEERRLMELTAQPWEPPLPAKLPVHQRQSLSGGGSYPLPWKHRTGQPMSKAYLHQQNPRVVFISSRVPAADVLVDAVLFGVIPLVYEYEGTTLGSLMSRLDLSLQGRNAQSIGMFLHSEEPGDLRLVHGATVNIDNLDTPEFVDFFENVSGYLRPESEGGHIDIFVPLASTESGMEMLIQLKMLTGVQFTSPTGIIGNYNHVNSEWLKSPENEAPPSHYFCASKLNMWANTADQVKEACQVTKRLIGRYFEQKHKDVVAQLTGQIIFDATGQVDISGVDAISEAMVDGLISLGEQQNCSEDADEVKRPLEHLGRFLLERSGTPDLQFLTTPAKQKEDTLTVARRMDANTLTAALKLTEKYDESLQNSEMDEMEDSEVAAINGVEKGQKERTNLETYQETLAETLGKEEEEDIVEEITEEVPEDIVMGDMVEKPRPRSRGTVKSVTLKTEPEYQISLNSSIEADPGLPTARGTMDQAEITTPRHTKTVSMRTPRQLTARQFSDHPEKRTPIAREILASEVAYMRTLEIIRTSFYTPIRAALSSNRAIISAHNAQIIFSDVLNLMDISRIVVEDLKSRQSNWNPQQCLGDVFVKFSTHLKSYVNFLNNYPMILTTIERCMEQMPVFRAFLKRHERQPDTKMLTLAELFLTPTRRIGEYVTLLTWFKTYTPVDHSDRPDLDLAIRKLQSLDDLIQETKSRAEKEKELYALQNKIIRCPLLVEANRYFIHQLDVANLKPPSSGLIQPELRTYQHIEMLGLFLFNDSLVVTRRTTRNFPFERAMEYNYSFEACMSLNRLRLEDIADSKFVRNAFQMYTPRRSWTCAADSPDDKTNWVTLLENTIRASVIVK